MAKINIDHRYLATEEIRKDVLPYKAYCECLINTFDLSQVKSVCDIGCATGHLIYFLKQNHNMEVKGYEYFGYHVDSEHCKVKDDITVYDIRDGLPDDIKQYDIVNCSEVGEHIDKEYANILIENCKKLSKKYIIFTWSSHGGDLEPDCDPHHQHLNPLSREDYMKLMYSHNLKPNEELTKTFLNHSMNNKHFYYWWRESFVIWEKI